MIIRAQAKENEIVEKIEEICNGLNKEENCDMRPQLLLKLEQTLNEYTDYRKAIGWEKFMKGNL